MTEKIIALTLLFLTAGASSLAHSAELETRYHASVKYKDEHGDTHRLPPVRVFIKHDSEAGLLKPASAKNCYIKVGKSDPIGLFQETESYDCVSTGSSVLFNREALIEIVYRSLSYSIRFSREEEMGELLNDIQQDGDIVKSTHTENEIEKKLKSFLYQVSGKATQTNTVSLKDDTEFTFKAGANSAFIIKLEFVKTK